LKKGAEFVGAFFTKRSRGKHAIGRISSRFAGCSILSFGFDCEMTKIGVAFWVSVVLLGVSSRSFSVEKIYQTGILVEARQKTHTRVLYYLVNTPVEQEDPYFEVSVKVNDVTYVGEYTPRRAFETLPDDWQPEESVQVRLEKHYMFVKRPNGSEMKLLLDSQTAKHPAKSR
jgi:hypothetical protein